MLKWLSKLFRRKPEKFKKIPMEEMENYFEWIHECSELLNCDGAHMITDSKWKHMFVIGTTPEQAVKAYKEQHG